MVSVKLETPREGNVARRVQHARVTIPTPSIAFSPARHVSAVDARVALDLHRRV